MAQLRLAVFILSLNMMESHLKIEMAAVLPMSPIPATKGIPTPSIQNSTSWLEQVERQLRVLLNIGLESGIGKSCGHSSLYSPPLFPPSSTFLIEGVIGSTNLFSES